MLTPAVTGGQYLRGGRRRRRRTVTLRREEGIRGAHARDRAAASQATRGNKPGRRGRRGENSAEEEPGVNIIVSLLSSAQEGAAPAPEDGAPFQRGELLLWTPPAPHPSPPLGGQIIISCDNIFSRRTFMLSGVRCRQSAASFGREQYAAGND